jgi:hypothetical protein
MKRKAEIFNGLTKITVEPLEAETRLFRHILVKRIFTGLGMPKI